MTVEHILRVKGRNVVPLDPQRTLAQAAQLLSERRIRAVIGGDTAHPVLAILSQRAIVHAIASRGPRALDEPVSRSMTQKVVTCTGASAIHEIMELMTDGKFRHVPVVEGGRLSGIVSIGDIVKHRLAEVEAETRAMRDYIATA